MDTADGAGAGMLLEPRSDALPVEVMPTLELTGVSAQLIVTDRAGILTGGLARKGMLSYIKTISN